MAATDLHQHLWPDGLLRRLARRTAPPRLRRDGRGWVLEQPSLAPLGPAVRHAIARVNPERVLTR